MTELELMIYGAIFLAAVLFVEGLFIILREGRSASKRNANRRARLYARGMDTERALFKLKRNRLTGEREGKDANKSPWLRPLANLESLLDESGLMISTPRYLLITALVITAIFAALRLLTDVPVVLSALLALPTGGALPLLFVIRIKRTRLAKFSEQLPEAIDMIVRSLRAGHPVRTAFAMVAREMGDPAGTEFGILLDEMTYGLDLEEALHNMEQRNDVPDLHYLVVTINLQSGTGGNLAEILSNLATVIRDRYRMYKKVRALSAEGRLSAMVIAFVPFFVVGVMWFNSPSYYLEAAEHRAFPLLIGFGVFLYFFSMFVIHRIVNFRV